MIAPEPLRRRALSGADRMEVLKRDGFACQYCGARAPDVVLVVDHVVPVARGGGNESENLLTACFTCNAGKTDRPLSESRPERLAGVAPPVSRAKRRRPSGASTSRPASLSGSVPSMADRFALEALGTYDRDDLDALLSAGLLVRAQGGSRHGRITRASVEAVAAAISAGKHPVVLVNGRNRAIGASPEERQARRERETVTGHARSALDFLDIDAIARVADFARSLVPDGFARAIEFSHEAHRPRWN